MRFWQKIEQPKQSVAGVKKEKMRTSPHRRNDDSNSILHVMVVGFHHKKGCQVEYCYPPLDGVGGEPTLPVEWQNLPSLALPDGVHNVEKDTVFFMLPSRTNVNKSIFGVSCYRQMAAKDLLTRGSDVTRTTVQKSVCVLTTVPLFGLLKAKMELITQAYFNERDFAKVEVLAEMYTSLEVTINQNQVLSQALIGISVRDLIRRFKHRVVQIFKLMLLERRVLIHMFPVYDLCHTILAVLSLFPGMVESGLSEACVYIPKNRLSREKSSGGADEISNTPASDPEEGLLREIDAVLANGDGPQSSTSEDKEEKDLMTCENAHDNLSRGEPLSGSEESGSRPTECGEGREMAGKSYSSLTTDGWGFPLSIYTKGSLCHPYLSLSFMDSLQSNRVRAYFFGATNALFKQRKDMLDVIISADEWGEMQVDAVGDETRHALRLTTADLRFAEHLCRQVLNDTGDIFVDATSWEGGDEWIRLQFRAYLLSLLATARLGAGEAEERARRDFNEHFVAAWKTTHNYRVWSCGHYPDLRSAIPGLGGRGRVDSAAVSRLPAVVAGNGATRRRRGGRARPARLQRALRGRLEDHAQLPRLGLRTLSRPPQRHTRFRAYLLSLLATARLGAGEAEERARRDFNEHFVAAWKTTHNYRVWSCGHYPDLRSAIPGHPFAGQLSMADVGVRLHASTHVRQLTNAVAQTGRSVRSFVTDFLANVSNRLDETDPGRRGARTDY